MLSGAPSAFAPASLPLGGTPDILDLQNLLMATSLLLGHQALPVAPEHMPAGLQALPWPCFAPRMTDLHPGVPRAFQGPSEGVRGWPASADHGMQRGRGTNSTGVGGGSMPCPGEMAFPSSAVMGRRWHWGPIWRAWQAPPKPEHPPGAAVRKLRGFYLKVICSWHYRSLLIRHWHSHVVHFSS